MMPFAREARAADWPTLLAAARGGDDDALGQICEQLRQYLLLMAQHHLGDALHAKLGASDIVQEAMLEACRDFNTFRGASEQEFHVWIKRLLRHNLIDSARSFRQTQRRDTSREVSLGQAVSLDQTGRPFEPYGNEKTASSIVSRREVDEELLDAIDKLSGRQRTIIELRHRAGLAYSEIANQMQMSEVAVRKLWSRTINALREQLTAGENAGKYAREYAIPKRPK